MPGPLRELGRGAASTAEPAVHCAPTQLPVAAAGSRWLLPAVAMLWLGAYLLLRSRHHLYDAVEYSAAVRDGLGLLHPHHLLYGPLGRALLGGASPDGVLRGLQILGALAVAGTLGLTGSTLQVLGAPRRLAACLTLLLGATAGLGFVATNVEVYPLAMLAEAAGLRILCGGPGLSTVRIVAAALLLALAALFHQTGVLAAAALAWVVFRRAGLRGALAFAGLAGASFWLAYLVAARSLGLVTARATLSWMFAYVDTAPFRAGVWGGGLSAAGLVALPFGIARTLYNPRLLDLLDHAGLDALGALDWLSLACFVLALASLGAAGRGLLRGRSLRRMEPQLVAVRTALGLWLGLHGAFTLWWEPGNPEFWLLLLPPLTVLLGSAAGRRALAATRRTEAFLVATALFLFLAGGCGRVFADTREDRNLALQLMRRLSRQPAAWRRNAIVATRHAELRPYTRLYFGPEAALETVSLLEIAPRTAAEKPAAIAAYRERLRRLAEQRPLYILDDEAHCPEGRVPALERFRTADCESAYRELLTTAERVFEVWDLGGPVAVYRVPPR